jgi:hypothetical protein
MLIMSDDFRFKIIRDKIDKEFIETLKKSKM